MGPDRRLLQILTCSMVLLLLVASATGRSFWVATTGSDVDSPGTEKSPFATISYALTQISASVPDTIIVQPGVYQDSLTFDAKSVVVRSAKGPKVTVIDGTDHTGVILFDINTPATTVLDGFTVRGGSQLGIRVHGTRITLPSTATVLYSSSPEIKNCIIRSNGGSAGAGGAGVRLEYSRSNFHNNIVDSNASNVNGGGMLILSSAPRVWNNRIEHNSVVDGVGGGIYILDTLDGGTAIIQNNLIVGNYAYNDGGGVFLSGDRIYFANNLVYGNSSRSLANGAGLISDYGAQTIMNNIFANNAPFAVYCFGSAIYQANCFFGNLPATQQSLTCPISTGNYDNVDPQFEDSAKGNFHLLETSPMIDTGAAPLPGGYDTDYDGFPRIVGKIDVGPFERTTCDLVPDFLPSSALCAGQTMQFINTSTGRYIMSIWDYGNGVVDSFPHPDATVPQISPKMVYALGGDYTVKLKLICPYDIPITTTKSITINNKPVVAFESNVSQGCAPLTVRFTNKTTGVARTDTWYFSDGISTIETSPEHVFVSPGTYAVKLVSFNSCGRDSILDTITVSSLSVAEFEADTTRGSAVLPVEFTGTASHNPTGWSWDFGDGGTATTQVASHNYSKPGIYDVSLTASNACGAGETYTRPDLIRVYGFKVKVIDADTTNRLQPKLRVRLDTLYGMFSNNILMSGTIAPIPRRGSAAVTFSRQTAHVLDSITATVTLSRDMAAGAYQLRTIAQSVFNSPADTLIWSFNSHPDTLIKLSGGEIDFDSVQVDTFGIDSIRVRNSSGLANPLNLRVTNAASTDPQFVVLDTTSEVIQPNGSFYIRVKFVPASLGEKSAFLNILSDDPALPSLLVTLRANVIPERKPPTVIATNPAHNAASVLIGSSVDLTLSEAADPTSITAHSILVRSRQLHADVIGTARLNTQAKISFVPQQRYLPYDTIDIKLLGTVLDRSGNSLDGNGNGRGEGSPADDYSFWFVTGPAVYPGDCNNDGRVNEMDVLPLGVFYAMTGPRRDSLGEETGWGAKQAVQWSDKRATYADADGNGTINAVDLLIIALNWGGTQPSASPLFADDFDYRPYAVGLSDLLAGLGDLEHSDEGRLIVQLLNSYVVSSHTPSQYSLAQNSPNPFNPVTQIGYTLPQGGNVTLTIYNVIGQTVKVIVDGHEEAGYRQVVWDGTDQSGRESASGIYFYRLNAGSFSQIRKMVKLR